MKLLFVNIIRIVILFVLLNLTGCKNYQSQKNESTVKKVFSNAELADVFKPLDGTWKGNFLVFIDTMGQRIGTAKPKNISFEYLSKLPLKIKSVIEAEHKYASRNAFEQYGQITDIYKTKEGRKIEVKSSAVNKIENGKLKCIVRKPGETVVHNGEYLGSNTITWHRDEENPRRIEYFRESVDSMHYKIIGWGYYGNDDTTLTPRTWFYADYQKVN